MRALIYRTSNFDKESVESPIQLAERVETGTFDFHANKYRCAWLVDIGCMSDLKAIADETNCQLVVSFPKERLYGQDIDIEIYDDYRE